MNRNTNAWSTVDTIDVPRSHWERKHTHITTFNAGKLVPIYFNEDIIPGTTLKINLSSVLRLQTPIYPTMDNLICDVWCFSAPKWWYWVHFKEQFMENKLGAWNYNQIEYSTPMIQVQTTAYGPNDFASYIGVPQGVTGFEWDRMAVNFYCDIWNTYFRSQPLQAPIIYDTSDNNSTSDGTILTGYGLLPLCRTFDPNSACLPEPQRAIPGMTGGVTIPLGTSAPVIGDGKALGLNAGSNINYGAQTGTGSYDGFLEFSSSLYGQNVGTAGTTPSGPGAIKAIGVTTDGTKSGLIADLTDATAATVNALRLNFAIQRIAERSAIYGGTMYRDTLHHWGTTASSLDLMQPEFCGGERFPINIEQCIQNSETTNSSPLGETGAYSVTANIQHVMTKSFTMHSMVMVLIGVRVEQHKYSQGLPRQFSRKRMLDHYWPELSHIGNEPRYNKQIFLQSDSVVNTDGNPVNDDVFGYQEYAQDYITTPNRATGEMDPSYLQSLDSWHYGDLYNSLPVLGSTWIEEPIYNIDRTLAVTSTDANQLLGDFYFEEEVSAPIPLNRLPGLIDHY